MTLVYVKFAFFHPPESGGALNKTLYVSCLDSISPRVRVGPRETSGHLLFTAGYASPKSAPRTFRVLYNGHLRDTRHVRAGGRGFMNDHRPPCLASLPLTARAPMQVTCFLGECLAFLASGSDPTRVVWSSASLLAYW